LNKWISAQLEGITNKKIHTILTQKEELKLGYIYIYIYIYPMLLTHTWWVLGDPTYQIHMLHLKGFVSLALVGKDIVFRSIIEYSSLMDFGP
jgi:hypothetical protein